MRQEGGRGGESPTEICPLPHTRPSARPAPEAAHAARLPACLRRQLHTTAGVTQHTASRRHDTNRDRAWNRYARPPRDAYGATSLMYTGTTQAAVPATQRRRHEERTRAAELGCGSRHEGTAGSVSRHPSPITLRRLPQRLTHSKPEHAAPDDELSQRVRARLQPRPHKEQAARAEHGHLWVGGGTRGGGANREEMDEQLGTAVQRTRPSLQRWRPLCQAQHTSSMGAACTHVHCMHLRLLHTLSPLHGHTHTHAPFVQTCALPHPPAPPPPPPTGT